MNTKTLIAVVTGIAIIILVNIWASNHDKEVLASSQKYQDCVYRTYFSTPSEFYSQNGYYPECK